MTSPPDPELLFDLETLVAEAVARFGTAGRVRVEGDRIHLQGHGANTTAPIGPLLEQWDELSPELKQRRATALARQLVERRRASSPPPAPARAFRLPSALAPLLILTAGGAAVYMAYLKLTPPRDAESPSATPGGSASAAPALGSEAYEQERQAREARVCALTRERVLRGTTVGPMDVEGWVVELVLLRAADADLTFDPALAAFIERRPGQLSGRFVWASAPLLAEREGPGTTVEIADAREGEALRGVRLTFSGRYVISYFTETQRSEYVRAAAALSDRLDARYGALFARCARSTTHELGAWFRGPGPAGAAASLVHFIAGQAAPAQLLPEQGGASAGLPELTARALPLDRARVARTIGAHGGMIAGKGGDSATTLTFPFKDGNRAGRASFDLARALGVARSL